MDDRHYTYIRDEIACQASIRLNRTEQDENIPFLIFISHESLYRSIVAVGGLLEFKIERRRCCCCFTDTECLQLCSALSCLGLQPIKWFDTWAESLVCRTCFIKTRSHIWPTDSDHLLFTLSLSLSLTVSCAWATKDENDTLPPGGTLIGPVSEDSHLPKCKRKATTE